MRAITSLFLILISLAAAAQQTYSIKGTVKDELGKPIAAASVFIANTTISTRTAANGEFLLSRIPPGDFNVTVSHISYELITVSIPAAERNNAVLMLKKKNFELDVVTIRNYVKKGWSKWGTTFTQAFIGTTAYADDCTIVNKDIIQFVFSNGILYAYAESPLIIENRALGYRVEANLVDFTYDVNTKNCVYSLYPFFKEMEGTEKDLLNWKLEREKAYYGSLMHFIRSLVDKNIEKDGFVVRKVEPTPRKEKSRVQGLYQQWYAANADLLDRNLNILELERKFEEGLSRDSVRYYRKVLLEKDLDTLVSPNTLWVKDIVSFVDNNTILFNFKDHLVVSYTKSEPPSEYMKLQFKLKDPYLNKYEVHQTSMITLSQGIPVLAYRSGYYKNIDLHLEGYWGWRERMGTCLPFDYNP